MHQLSNQPERDPYLWEIAKKRASFKWHLYTYLIINAFLWVIWFLTGSRTYDNAIPWPVWSTLGWGIGLASHYIGAYIRPQRNTIEDEYEKLVRKNNGK